MRRSLVRCAALMAGSLSLAWGLSVGVPARATELEAGTYAQTLAAETAGEVPTPATTQPPAATTGSAAESLLGAGATDDDPGSDAGDPEAPVTPLPTTGGAEGQEQDPDGDEAVVPGTGEASEQTGAEPEAVDPARKELDELALKNKDVLKDGTYAIQLVETGRGVLDVDDNSGAPGANVQLWSSNGSSSQRWVVSHDAQGYVTFTHQGTSLVLDVSGGLAQAGANVQQYGSNGSYAQRWVVVANGDGTYRIVSALDEGLAVGLPSGSGRNGSNVALTSADNAGRASFVSAAVPEVAPSAQGLVDEGAWYVLAPACAPNNAVDVAGASRDAAANVQLYQANGSFAQLYRFEWHDGYYLVINANSGKALDVAGGDVVPGANVAQYEPNAGNANMLFALVKNADGSLTLVNKASGLVLDVSGGSSASGANLDAYASNGTAAQRFSITKQVNLVNEGLYTVAAAGNESMVLDVAGASQDDGANVQLYGSNGSFAQKWYVTRVPGRDNTYALEVVASSKRLAVDGSGNVVQRGTASDPSQWWTVKIGASGAITFESVARPGRVLDIAGGNLSNGANVQTYAANGTQAQGFRLNATGASMPSGTYFIQMAYDRGKVLDVAGGSTGDHANVQVWSNNDSGAQKWVLVNAEGGTYVIVNAASGKALDITDARAFSGANVQQFQRNGNVAQRWYIGYKPGGFKIASVLDPSFVLDVSGGKGYDGANLQVYENNNSQAQRFVFTPTVYIPPMPQDQRDMLNRAQLYASNTNWLILVNTSTCRVGIFNGSRGSWQLRSYWECSPGKASTPTVLGQYTVQAKGFVFGHGYSCYYWTQFYGDYLFHSVLYDQGTFRIQDGRLGQNLSHGCVRLDINNAKWIYDNIPRGTKVVTYR